MSEYEYLIEKGLKRALELGASEAEISITVASSKTVKTEGPYPKVLSQVASDVWVRTSIGKRVAIATATSSDWEILEKTIARSVEMARKAEEDPHWEGLPDPEPPSHGWIGFDEGIVNLEIEQLVEVVKNIIQEVQDLDPRLRIGSVGGSTSTMTFYNFNTRGVRAEDRGTNMELFVWLKSTDGLREGAGSGWISARSFIYDYTSMIEKAKQLALDSLKAEKLGQTISGSVLFRAEPLASLISYLLLPAFNAMNVLEGFSPLREKLGEKVLGELTMLDDGTLPGGLSTSLFDAEGVPRRRTLLVENGVIRSFLHNTYTAKRMKTSSTGNASRGRGVIGISGSNIVIKGGKDPEESLMEDAKIVVDGSLLSVHTVNSVTGNFSVVASNPYLVKGRELVPVKPVTVSGNIYAIANTLRPAVQVKNTFTGVYTPDILFGKLTVSG